MHFIEYFEPVLVDFGSGGSNLEINCHCDGINSRDEASIYSLRIYYTKFKTFFLSLSPHLFLLFSSFSTLYTSNLDVVRNFLRSFIRTVSIFYCTCVEGTCED